MKLLALGTLALCGTLCLYLLSETPSSTSQQQLFLASENEQEIQ
jgi:C1A family cysteine protease